MLLQLTVAWYLTDNEDEKQIIHESANGIREKFNSGMGGFLDSAKSFTGYAADEFSWFLGGDVARAERDYWLNEVSKYQNVTIDEKQSLQAIMFVASICVPGADDAYKFISKKASKEMLETIGENGAKKFYKAMTKYAGKQGEQGIKNLGKNGIKYANKIYQYEVKVKGVGGAYRLLGNVDEFGNLVFEVFAKTHK